MALDPIQKARELAQSVRFCKDPDRTIDNSRIEDRDQWVDYFFRTGLMVDAISAPSIHRNVIDVCEKLFIPEDRITTFVYASSDINAACITVSPEKCLIQISSGLISLMSDQELQFVIAHELGHFLLSHGLNDMGQETVESYMIKRAQEISVDRIGLIGCGDIKFAVSSLIKTISGLDEKYLGFDVGQFISQVNKISNPAAGEGVKNSHPSLLIRCRALLWFASVANLKKICSGDFELNYNNIDDRVIKELEKFVDGPMNRLILGLINEISLWKAALMVLKDGTFDKIEQRRFRNKFGDENYLKFKNLLSNLSKNETISFIENKLKESEDKLGEISPRTVSNKIDSVNKELITLFGD